MVTRPFPCERVGYGHETKNYNYGVRKIAMALPSNLSAGLDVFNTTAAAVASILHESRVTVSKTSGGLGPHVSGGGAR